VIARPAFGNHRFANFLQILRPESFGSLMSVTTLLNHLESVVDTASFFVLAIVGFVVRDGMAEVDKDQLVHCLAIVGLEWFVRRRRRLLPLLPCSDQACVLLLARGGAVRPQVVVAAIDCDNGQGASLVIAVGGDGTSFDTCHGGLP